MNKFAIELTQLIDLETIGADVLMLKVQIRDIESETPLMDLKRQLLKSASPMSATYHKL